MANDEQEQTKARVRACYTCGGRVWWERPASAGGGLVCARCHPNPAPARRAWEEARHGDR